MCTVISLLSKYKKKMIKKKPTMCEYSIMCVDIQSICKRPDIVMDINKMRKYILNVIVVVSDGTVVYGNESRLLN